MRTFTLVRDTDVSGISGTGVVAEGIEFSSGVVALTWTSDWPTSVVFHERGIESVEAIHGHGGATRIVFAATLSKAVTDEGVELAARALHDLAPEKDCDGWPCSYANHYRLRAHAVITAATGGVEAS